MRIAQVHNTYQIAGGEDRVVELERRLLEAHGHEVVAYTVTNDDIVGVARKAATMLQTPYNRSARVQMRDWLEARRPDIVHVHNFFPRLSPSIYDACADARVAVVQTLHNFRTMCPGAFLLRDGRFCDKCVGKVPYWGIVHRCYRGSAVGSLAVAGMIVEYHRAPQRVHRYIALNGYARRMFVRSGLPQDRIAVKPNFVADVGPPPRQSRSGGLFVGRLSVDKGVSELVRAWHGIGTPLRIGGTGPLEERVRDEAPPSVSFLGWLGPDKVREAMLQSAFLLVPSLSTEQFPMALVEAFACGLPVITSRTEALSEIVIDGETGILSEPGNVEELRAKIQWAVDHPDAMLRMGIAARKRYETLYSEGVNYQMIMDIYRDAVLERDRAAPAVRAGQSGMTDGH
jgi:glycosyltransferase involved in cell wall biosynthesis